MDRYLVESPHAAEECDAIIKEIHADDPNPYIELQDGRKIVEKTIAALNGLFRPEYSGC